MKNLMSFIVIATILVFTSCAKETIILPETDNSQLLVTPDTDLETAAVSNRLETADNETTNKSNTTITLQTTVVSVSQAAGEYIVDLSVNHDCTSSEVVSSQTVEFKDANNKPVYLTFQVNSYTGSNGALQVSLDLSGHNLSGLTLKAAQDIVIEDISAN